MKKECNCCMKLIKQPQKCFINKECNWISCPSCIAKQIKIKPDFDITYCCPNCRKQSIFIKHSKITKYFKSNRNILNNIIKLQRDLLIKQNEKITEIHQIASEPIGQFVDLTSIEDLEPIHIFDMASNELSQQVFLLQQ